MKHFFLALALFPTLAFGQGQSAAVPAGSLPVTVLSFGCAADASSDDSQCINAAIAAAPAGSMITVPAKMFAVGKSIILDKGKRLNGSCGTSARSTATCSSGFIALPSLAGKSLISVTGNGSEISGLFFNMNSVAANTIELHTDSAYGAYIHDNSFVTASPVSPPTLYDNTHYIFANGAGHNGLYGLNIIRNWFWDGIKDAIYTVNGGDSCNIRDNLFSLTQGGGGYAIYWNSTGNASHLAIETNNITGGSQMIYIKNAYEPKILKNQIEMPFQATGTYRAMLTLDSIYGGAQVELNNMNAEGHVADAIHLKNAPRVSFHGNTISNTAPGQPLYTDAQSIHIVWEQDNVNDQPGSDAPGGTVQFTPLQSQLAMAQFVVPFYNSGHIMDQDSTNFTWNPSGHYLTAGTASSIDSKFTGGFRLMNGTTQESRYYYSGGVILDRVAGTPLSFTAGGSLYNQFDSAGNLVFANNKGQHINTKAPSSDIAGACRLASGSCSVSFAASYNGPPICTATDQTNAAPVRAVPTASSLMITGGSGAGANDVIAYVCIGNPN